MVIHHDSISIQSKDPFDRTPLCGYLRVLSDATKHGTTERFW
jgi:hypothetical protein